MSTTRHLLIRSIDGRTLVVDERTGAPAGVLDMGERRASGAAFVWFLATVMFSLGAVAGVMAAKAGAW